jgi:hypothetical protein
MTAADHFWSGHHSLPRPVNRHPARRRFSDAAAIFDPPKSVSRNSDVGGRTSLEWRPGGRTWFSRQIGGAPLWPQHLCVGIKQTKAAQFTNCPERYRFWNFSISKQFLILQSLY